MTMSDYSDLEKEIENAPEPKILPAGSEVKARIILVNSGVSEKNDAKWYTPVFDIPSETLAPSFSDFFWDLLDENKIEPKQVQAAKRQYRMFGEAFDIDWSRPLSWEDDLPGKEGWMILGIQKDKSGEYPDKNKVQKYVTGPPNRKPRTDDDIPF